jgi:hypothetical protein
VAENHNEPQAFAQVFEGVPQATEDIVAKAVASNPDDKQVVWSLVKEISSIGTRASEHPSTTAKGCCDGALFSPCSNPRSRGSTSITRRASPAPSDKLSSNVAKA